MTTTTLKGNTETAPLEASRARSRASSSRVGLVERRTLAKPCCDCSSRERCPASRLTLTDNNKQPVSVISRSHTFAPGAHVFREGDKAEAVYILKSGSAKVYFTLEDGSEQVVAFYMPGDVLGLDALGVERHSSSALALENTFICVMPLTALEAACAKLSASGWHHCFYSLLSRELIRDHRTIELITKKDAEAKMASFLLHLSKRFRERGYSGSSFNLSMKRSEIGSHLGLAVETVSRVLTRFQADGLLQVERRRVQILDHVALEALTGCHLSH